MEREEKEMLLLQCCKNRVCNDCPAFSILGEFEECDFEEMEEKVLDRYLEVFGVSPPNEDKTRMIAEKLPEPETDMPDNVHPQHYKLPGGMEVIDIEVAMFGREAVMHHCFCTAAEYILRHVQKNGVEDIRKAHWWLSKFIELESGA